MKTIMHGSPVSGLKRIGPEKGRFGEKIFGTTDLQKTVRYLASVEGGGESWRQFEGDSRMFVFGANPQLLLEESGSIYLLPREGFEADLHKGDRPWILSHQGGVEVLKEIKFPCVLEAWNEMEIYAVPDYLTDQINSNDLEERRRAMEVTVRLQEELLIGQDGRAKKIIEDNLAEWMVKD